jgi:hypothetical protein
MKNRYTNFNSFNANYGSNLKVKNHKTIRFPQIIAKRNAKIWKNMRREGDLKIKSFSKPTLHLFFVYKIRALKH